MAYKRRRVVSFPEPEEGVPVMAEPTCHERVLWWLCGYAFWLWQSGGQLYQRFR